MTITTLRYRRIRNLGNYESETLEVEVTVDPDQDPALLFEEVRTWVCDRLNIRLSHAPRANHEQEAI